MDPEEIFAGIELRARIAGISMRKVCQKAKVHPTTVSRWKKSPNNPEPIGPTIKTLVKLKRALDELTAPERKAQRKPVAA